MYQSSLSAQVDLSKKYTLETLQEMLQKARSENNQKDLADVYFLIAEIQEKEKFNSELALELYIRANQYYEKIGDLKQSNVIKRYLAERYSKSGFLQESLGLYREVLNYYQSIKDSLMQARLHYDISKVLAVRADMEESLNSLQRAITLNESIQDTSLMVNILLDKVSKYILLNERDSALITSTLAFDISSDADNKKQIAKSLFYIGYINMKDVQFKKAIKYLEKSVEINPALPYDSDRRETYKNLIKAYENIDDFEKSLMFSKKYVAINDSILNRDRITSINNLSIKHQSYEKNKEIQLLELENQNVNQKNIMQRNVLYFVAGGFGLLLIALYYIIRFYSQKIRTENIINTQQHKIDQQKIKELEDTMQINNMQSMIIGQERERERIAKDLHDSLGGLLSTVKLQFDQFKSTLSGKQDSKEYYKAADLLDSAVEEVRVISRNLQPGALSKLGLIPAINDLINRFDGDNYPTVFFQHYNLPLKISEMVGLNIYRIIQELMNNTIKYADASEVLIQLNYKDGDLYVQYEDDGVGFNINNLNARGMGLENIEYRVRYLKGRMSIETKEGDGVSYFIKIPLNI
jgi:signal transduction histidine kinase